MNNIEQASEDLVEVLAAFAKAHDLTLQQVVNVIVVSQIRYFEAMEEEEEREPYMTHSMLVAEQSIDEMNAWEQERDYMYEEAD